MLGHRVQSSEARPSLDPPPLLRVPPRACGDDVTKHVSPGGESVCASIVVVVALAPE